MLSYFYQKTINKQSWKLSKVKFWPKLNMENNTYTKLFKCGTLPQLTCFISLLNIGEMLWSHRKLQRTEVLRKLGQPMTKNCLLRQSHTKYLEPNRGIVKLK